MDLSNECYKELYKHYETERLILERTTEQDYYPLAQLMFNKNVNIDYQRPTLYLNNINDSIEFIKSQSNNSVSFTIKLKNDGNPIIMGQIGFYYVDLTCKEIGIFYYIGENFQKKGYAGEAAIPLIGHLFDNLPCTKFIKIDYNENNIGSKKIADKICADILKNHPSYHLGNLFPFVDKYTMVGEPKDGKVNYYFEGFDRQCNVSYPENFFNGQKYFEKKSNGVFIMKED